MFEPVGGLMNAPLASHTLETSSRQGWTSFDRSKMCYIIYEKVVLVAVVLLQRFHGLK